MASKWLEATSTSNSPTHRFDLQGKSWYQKKTWYPRIQGSHVKQSKSLPNLLISHHPTGSEKGSRDINRSLPTPPETSQ
ncbi:unnamed protein product [Brassica oleracea]